MRNYSETYQEARKKFLVNAEIHGAKLTSLVIDEERSLSIDIASFGKENSEQLVLCFSGVHGGEGYVGSAIQITAMEELKKRAEKEGIRIVLVHAVNPYGMEHYQRFNEKNIDLNRNANAGPESSPNANPIYESLNTILNPGTPYSSYDEFENAVKSTDKKEITKVLPAIIGGQSKYPDGIFYTGNEKSSELIKIFEFLASLSHEKLKQVTMLDIHTGVGKENSSTIGTLFSLFSETKNEIIREQVLANEVFSYKSQDNGSHVVGDMPTMMGTTAEQVRKGGGFSGNFAAGVANCFPKKVPFKSFVLEFGTVGDILKELFDIVNYNALRKQQTQEIKSNHPISQALRESFYPSNQGWRKEALNRGVEACKSMVTFSKRNDQHLSPNKSSGSTLFPPPSREPKRQTEKNFSCYGFGNL